MNSYFTTITMSESNLEEYKDYYDNGKLKRHYYYSKYNKLHGEYKYWYKNGQLVLHSFLNNDKQHGECRWWYENGQIYIHTFYNNGKLHGEYKWWHENDQIGEHTFWKDGKRYGESKEWCIDGQIIQNSFWNDDKEISKYTWNCLIKVQRAYRIKYKLKKYFTSKAFVEWWYHPDMPGGKAAKKDLESFAESL